jgi:TorA maturation chaperone TorD
VATLCEIMAGLVNGSLPAAADTDRKVFDKHMKPWVARFFSDLEQAEAANFYARVGALGRAFVEIESEGFALPS